MVVIDGGYRFFVVLRVDYDNDIGRLLLLLMVVVQICLW